jgi:hypothetical protein
MKTCRKCGVDKDESEFSKKKESLDGLQPYCRDCNSAQYEAWYSSHKKQRVKYCTNLTAANRKRLTQWYHELKTSKPCKDCGQTYSPWVMEYDHIGVQKKSRDVSKMVARNCSKEAILKEISKCELVCANCHRERTWQRHLAKI